MNLKKLLGTATLAGAMAAAGIGLGAGAAQADPGKWEPWVPWVPVIEPGFNFNQPPGHIGQQLGIPPGQLKKVPDVVPGLDLPVVDNPVEGVPPGHWDDWVGEWVEPWIGPWS